MTARVSRLMVALAAHLLGPARRDWGSAMRAELEWAIAEGRACCFARGCLIAAVCALPTRREGRLALAAHALALGVTLPAAAALVCTAAAGHPFAAAGGQWALSDGEVALAPSLALLSLAMAAAQLLLAWFMAERDWPRAIAAATSSAAMLAALVPLAALLSLGLAVLMPPLILLAGEAAALRVLMRRSGSVRGAMFRPSG